MYPSILSFASLNLFSSIFSLFPLPVLNRLTPLSSFSSSLMYPFNFTSASFSLFSSILNLFPRPVLNRHMPSSSSFA